MSDPQQQQQQSSSAAAQQQQQQQPSRFKAPSNLTTQERLSTNTVGLVALSDFRKRRAEVLEQQEREAREALRSGTNTPKLLDSRSRSATPNNDGSAAGGGGGGGGGDQQEAKRAAKKVKKQKKALVSFGDDDEEEDGPAVVMKKKKRQQTEAETEEQKQGSNDNGNGNGESEDSNSNPKKPGAKITANAAVGVVPRALTKAALRREAAERDALRKEFLILQEAVKNTEIAIPFVFYDGTNTPGGTVRVRKGEFVWVFLDKGRKVGAELAMGGDKNAHARRDWARVGVDDLLLVRGTMIIPHHYEFYFFIMNKTIGPAGVRLFDYSAEVPTQDDSTPSSARGGINTTKTAAPIHTLEGYDDDPTFTKVVDRRWYERNKHIYPASMWQEFDPEKDYTSEVRKDTGGNTFFFAK